LNAHSERGRPFDARVSGKIRAIEGGKSD